MTSYGRYATRKFLNLEWGPGFAIDIIDVYNSTAYPTISLNLDITYLIEYFGCVMREMIGDQSAGRFHFPLFADDT